MYYEYFIIEKNKKVVECVTPNMFVAVQRQTGKTFFKLCKEHYKSKIDLTKFKK